MKKLVLFMLMATLCWGIAMADTTGGAKYSSPNGHADGLADFLNDQECIDHKHNYEKYDRDNQVGIGVDVTVWQSDDENQEVNVEQKYDFRNDEYSVFTVYKANLWSWIKGE